MKYHIELLDFSSIDEIKDKWSHDDYVNLLELIEFGDTGDADDQDLKELLFLSLSEMEPQEAAEIVLRYKFKDELNDGQYEQISNDMLKENVAEHYSDISFHSRLFDVNVFLYKAFNGTFPHAKASVIKFKAATKNPQAATLDEADALRLLSHGIQARSIFQRLYSKQLSGEEDFDEAQHIAWYFENLGDDTYQLITSDYWISKDEMIAGEFDATLPESD
ncbi:hypothetical protein [Nonlabens ponticola]|uniref:Uncharacterized protein n=1 Tax=Nonlabens ponticola TaxID=2496866 RepID=A0A3S9MZT9_9FLAO|nr:hypothetical protein [Nonlabens ponticola]AZQ44602.1 hypothetical protein EJ995_10230 [Nonlabens ponticola]